MTDLNISINTGGDDCHAKLDDSNFSNTATALYLGATSTAGYHTGLVFRNVTIPQGAEIVSAKVRFIASWDYSNNTCNVKVHCEDADDATAATSGSQLNGLSLTTGVAWNAIGSWLDGVAYDTPDISSEVQIVIDRSGWVSGNDLGIHLLDNSSSSSAYRQPSAFEAYGGTEAAELIITYEPVNVVSDDFTIGDTIEALGPVQVDLSDDLTIDDTIIAAGGSTFATASDNLTIDDTIIAQGPVPVDLIDNIIAFDIAVAGFQYERDLTDNLTIDDSIVVGFEYSAPLSDDLTIDDSTDCFLWSEWLRENYGKYIIRYYATLTGEADNESDQELPFSSFQSTKRTGSSTYLSIIVPGFEYISEITARSNGALKVDMAYIVDGAESFRETIIEVDLETVRIYEGTSKRSIALSGSRAIDYKENLITLENPIYTYISEGKVRYRFLQADPWLNAGDTVRCRDDEFVADYITYTISDRFKQMEVSGT